MKKHTLPFVFVFALLIMAAGCKKDDTVQNQQVSQVVQSTITGVNGPISGTVNQELIFSLVWLNTNGTTKFDHLQDSSADNARIIKLYALTNAVDTSATANKTINPVTYKFKASVPGTYYLNFYKAGNAVNTAIIDTLTIK